MAAVLLAPLFLGSVHLWNLSVSAVFLAAAFLFNPARGRVRTPLDAWIGFYLLLFAASVFFSRIPVYSWTETFKLAVYVAVYYASVLFCRDRRRVEVFGGAILLLGGALSFVGLLQYAGALPKTWWQEPRFLSSVYVNHNHFAGLLELILPVSLGFAFAERNGEKKLFYFSICGLMALALALTLSRGAYVAGGAALCFMAFFMARGKGGRHVWAVFGALAFFVFSVIFFFQWEAVAGRFGTFQRIFEADASFSDRLKIWSGAWEIARQNPWFGTGPGTFGHLFLPHRPEGYFHRPEFTHNDYLNLATDCGWPALAAVMVLFAVLFRKGLRTAGDGESRVRSRVATGCLAALLAMAVHSLIDFNLHMPANMIWFCAIAGLLTALAGQDGEVPRNVRILILTPLIFFLVSGSALLGVSDFYFWKAKKEQARRANEQARFSATRSIKFNPFNDEARFVRGRVQADASAAAGDFKYAASLNSYEPYYGYHEVKNLLRAGRLGTEEAAQILENNLRKDPNDPKLNFISGRLILSLKDAGPEPRTAAFRWLDDAARLDPKHAERVVDLLNRLYRRGRTPEKFSLSAFAGSENTAFLMRQKDFWKGHRNLFLKRLGIDPNVKYRALSAHVWAEETERFTLSQFKRRRSDARYGADSLFMNDLVVKRVVLKDAPARLKIRARGSAAGDSYPYFLVSLDGKTVEAIHVAGRSWARYDALIEAPPGEYELGIEFVNDLTDSDKNLDRNLWIESVEIQYPKG